MRLGDVGVVAFFLVPILGLPSAIGLSIQFIAAFFLLSREFVLQDSTTVISRCTACRYDLAGLSLPTKCPECGTHNMAILSRSELQCNWMSRADLSLWACIGFIGVLSIAPLTWMALYRVSGAFPISFQFALLGPYADGDNLPGALGWYVSAATFAALSLSLVCPRLPRAAAIRATGVCLFAIAVALFTFTVLSWFSGTAVHWQIGRSGRWLGFFPLLGTTAAIFGVTLGHRGGPNLPQ